MAAFRGCEICKQPIEPERAEADPTTQLCAKHAHEVEEFGGEFRTIANLEVTSKQGSLKKNYGGVSTHRRRNKKAIQKLREAYEARSEK